MTKMQMFHFAACPYCREATRWMDELRREYPELRDVHVERIDEKLHPEIAEQYDYWYVPTFFVDGKKVHEGACTREIVERVLRMGV